MSHSVSLSLLTVCVSTMAVAFLMAFFLVPHDWIKVLVIVTVAFLLVSVVTPLTVLMDNPSGPIADFFEINKTLPLTFEVITDHISRVALWAVLLIASGGILKQAFQEGAINAGWFGLGVTALVVLYISILVLNGIVFIWRTVALKEGVTTKQRVLFSFGYGVVFLGICSLSTHFALASLEGYVEYLG